MGYQNRTNVKNYNYVVPTFVNVNDETIVDIQDIQLDSTVSSEASHLCFYGANKKVTETFVWFKTTSGKAGPSGQKQETTKGGLWFLRTGYTEPEDPEEDPEPIYEFVSKTFAYGTGVQIYYGKDDKVSTFSGAVSDAYILSAAVKGYNFVGNPYPATINLQDIQLGTATSAVSSEASTMDVRGSNKKVTHTYTWFKASSGKAGPGGMKEDVPEGSLGRWFERLGYTEPEDPEEDPEPIYASVGDSVTFDAGQCVIIYFGTAGKTITVLPPYEI